MTTLGIARAVALLLLVFLPCSTYAQGNSGFDVVDGSNPGAVLFLRSKDLKGECAACRQPAADACNRECLADFFSIRFACDNKAIFLEFGPIAPKDKSKLASDVDRMHHLVIQLPGQTFSSAITETSFILRDYDAAFDLRLSANFQPSLRSILERAAETNGPFFVILGKRRYAINATGSGQAISQLIRRCGN